MLQIRTMTAADVPLGMQLKAEAGWNQTPADWQRFLELAPEGCYVAQADAQPVGTTAVFELGDVAWIAMVLVAQSHRGQGIGTALMRQALADLDRRGVPSIRLDATALGRPIYEKLGFVAQFEVLRYDGVLAAAQSVPAPPAGRHEPSLEAIADLDREVTRTDRRRLLAALWRQQPDAWFPHVEAGRLRGYLTLREGSQAVQIGPAVAETASAGETLFCAAAAAVPGRRVYLDIPRDNTPACRWAEAHGLTVQRPFIRMVRGRAVAEDLGRLWASSGPEKG